jgi:hypothetical protein
LDAAKGTKLGAGLNRILNGESSNQRAKKSPTHRHNRKGHHKRGKAVYRGIRREAQQLEMLPPVLKEKALLAKQNQKVQMVGGLDHHIGMLGTHTGVVLNAKTIYF